MRSFLSPFLLAALSSLASCLNITPCGTTLASEPPGARVRVDGRDSGWVTPCMIALDAEETHVVTLELDGFAPREVVLEPLERHGIVLASGSQRREEHHPLPAPLADGRPAAPVPGGERAGPRARVRAPAAVRQSLRLHGP
jgi:hypothetical protein